MSRENHYINIPRLIPSVTSVQEVVRHFDHKRNSNVWFMRLRKHHLYKLQILHYLAKKIDLFTLTHTGNYDRHSGLCPAPPT